MDHPFRILMVEDMARYHQLFAAEITDAMHATVDFCTSGEDALKQLHEDPKAYDLLLLDLNLPGINGQEVLKKLRSSPDFDGMPIMILTGNSDPDLQSQLFGAGADEFIEKGSAPEVFVARLKAQVKHKLTLDRLTQLAVDRESFAAGVLHDIRNIEMNLLAACELIEMQIKKDAEKNKDQIIADLAAFKEQIQRIDTYATSVIKKVREGESKVRMDTLQTSELVSWVEQFLSGVHSNFKITMQGAEGWPPLLADRHLLQSALLNLIQNSIKYARPDTPPEIKISQYDEGNARVICLRDNGIGVPKEVMRKIFEPFFRAHPEKEAESHGLGLSMVSNVVGKMKGRVWAELPEDGQAGTVFKIALPIEH